MPIIYVVTMMISREIAMKNTAPEQNRIMCFLPIAFGFVLFRFPAGLFIYWVSSNLIMVVQNLLIYGLPRSGKQAAP